MYGCSKAMDDVQFREADCEEVPNCLLWKAKKKTFKLQQNNLPMLEGLLGLSQQLEISATAQEVYNDGVLNFDSMIDNVCRAGY